MVHSLLDYMNFTINCATTIVALLDEGSKLMANTFYHTSFVKTNPKIAVVGVSKCWGLYHMLVLQLAIRFLSFL
jgi:hypothetical protein